jgi:hypothetical protein
MALFDLTASTNARKVPILNTDYPQDVIIKATDGNASFKAAIAKDGRPDKYTYLWYVDGVVVPEATGAEYVRDVSGDKGVHTVFCEVTNKAGTVRTREATLTVKRLPVLNGSYPENVSVFVGSSATLQAVISEDGYPANYSYQWYLNGAAVSGATGTSFNHYRSLEGSDTVYCIVTNEAGSVRSRDAVFTANRIYLYNKGDQCTGITGGWVPAVATHSAERYNQGLTHASEHMSLLSRANEYNAGCGTSWLIDLSKQTKLSALVSTDNTGSCMIVSSQLYHFDAYAIASGAFPTSGTVSIDISNVNSGHITFLVPATGTEAFSGNIYSVWLG